MIFLVCVLVGSAAFQLGRLVELRYLRRKGFIKEDQ